MKNYILLFSTALVISACGTTEDSPEVQPNEDIVGKTDIDEETVIDLGEKEAVNNEVKEKYFFDLSEFPTEKGSSEGNKEDNTYWIRANGFPVRGEEYFSSVGLVYAEYDADTDKIEIAHILNEESMIQDIPIEEDLYVSWVYDFTNGELQDLVQVNAEDEPQDVIPFSKEEWSDFSNGYKENLLQMLK
ncbi:hypothetical protein AB4027_11475 [Alkalibacterium putridalgicola]|uniref:hypothetical protein n=1 Tax=Alkalibacterium putridalgicola TaxID=426703 RepID=UPI0034CD6749